MQRPMHDNELPINADLVLGLIGSHFPQWADEAVAIVEPWGTDNAIYRLGDELVVRLPRVEWAANQVEFEAVWLPKLAGRLPVEVPVPVAVGEPALGYPYQWAVHRWMLGTGASLATIADPEAFAHTLAATVRALWSVPATGLRPACNRARALQDYDEATRAAIDSASHLVDADAALAVWEAGLAAAPHDGEPAWVHGDLEGNCLTLDGELHGLIDWGCSCLGDPAVDVQVAWSPLFTDASRAVFLDQVGADANTIARARAAAVNQACGALPYYLDTYPLIVERSWHKLAALGIEPLRSSARRHR